MAAGGSGGSVFLEVGSLDGAGVVSADGGAASNGNSGGGGGGRIAVYTADLLMDMAQLSVAGGWGRGSGEVGTIYVGEVMPLRVLTHEPEGLLDHAVDQIDIRFNREIDPATFTVDDVALVGPGAVSIPIAADPVDVGDKTWRIAVDLSSNGTYTLAVGPDVSDPDGADMDQDGDGTPGEDPDDIYTGTFTIDTTPPEIVGQTPTGEVNAIVNHIDLTTSEDVIADNCTTNGITLIGPAGAIGVSAPVNQGGDVWRISFIPQAVPGEYTLTVAPGCFVDQAGLEMADSYVGNFTIALESGYQVLVVTVSGGYNADGANLYQTVVNAGCQCHLCRALPGWAGGGRSGGQWLRSGMGVRHLHRGGRLPQRLAGHR